MKRLLIVLAVVALPQVGAEEGPSDPLAANRAVVRRQHEELWSRGTLHLVEELYTPDFVCHFVGGPDFKGFQGVRDAVRNHRTSFPDWTERIDAIIAERDVVVTRFTSTGTNTGSLAGRPPTGKRVQISEVAIYRIANGKIAEQWAHPDLLGLHRQLGWFPEPGPPK